MKSKRGIRPTSKFELFNHDSKMSFQRIENTLLEEKGFFLSERKSLGEGLSNPDCTPQEWEDIYINELRMSLKAVSSSRKPSKQCIFPTSQNLERPVHPQENSKKKFNYERNFNSVISP